MTQSSRYLGAAACALAVLAGCGPTAVDPVLSLTPRPRTIDNLGQVSTITVTASDKEGKPGTGTVRLTSVAGTFGDGLTVTLGADGTATADFSCDVRTDVTCSGASVRVTAIWTTGGVEITTGTSLTLSSAGADGGTDGGAADAGTMVDAGTDAGTTTADAGLTLTAGRTTIFAGVGDSTPVTATLRLGAQPQVGATVDFATTLGTLSLPDGGAATSAVTDAQGRAVLTLTAGSTPGTASLTAVNVASGLVANLPVEILAVNSITHTLTTCDTGTTSCGVMGIRGSGFNENALVRFRVADSMGRPVAGVPVTFVANNPPNGTTVSPSGVTDAMGIAAAVVQSGFAVGTFTVTATVSSVSATSPSIGVRGAKPSNNGISISCNRINLAAYLSPAPPLVLTNACTVTLLDRLGNYVGVPQTLSLFTEAGSVPANVTTAGFASGPSTEGRGAFTFSTSGIFPPDDVAPLAASATQYPIALVQEPSWADGAITRNPRDGLVTILALVTGEEHFYDDNQNGTWDTGERFIDQGEPLLDRNDNNVWDPGEYYEDKNGNNAWDPPNGVWDRDAAVWTVVHLLYTDVSRPSRAVFSPPTFDVAKGATALIYVYMPDLNLNRIESGASLAFTRTATKGAVSIINSNVSLDGYGFGLTSRELLDATGTGPCTNTTSRCTFFTRFTTWDTGYVGQLRLVGASTTDTTPSQIDVITVNSTVRGVTAGAALSGTFQ